MTATTFRNPPIDEVVCSVYFASERPMRTVDIGVYWESIQSDFPGVSDQAPIAIIKTVAAQQEIEIDIPTLPPLRRVWFESADGTRLIQIQSGQFHYNWRRRQGNQQYPRYEKVVTEFLDAWERFSSWSKDHGPGNLKPSQYELSYINQLSGANGLTTPGRCHELLRYMAKIDNGTLPEPVGISNDLIFPVSEGNGQFHISTRQGIRIPESIPVITVRLTARGYSEKSSLRDWFANARNLIVSSFRDLTTAKAHEIWGLEK